MKRPDAIEILIQLAQKASDEQARTLGNALRREFNDKERLRLLSDYRNEYLTRYNKLRNNGVSAVEMLNFQQFLDKLDVAIAQQYDALGSAQTAAGSARAALGESERSRQSLVLLRDRRKDAAQSVEIRREQKLHDEFAMQNARRRSPFSGRLE
jgi:flagellar protein FliJ